MDTFVLVVLTEQLLRVKGSVTRWWACYSEKVKVYGLEVACIISFVVRLLVVIEIEHVVGLKMGILAVLVDCWGKYSCAGMLGMIIASSVHAWCGTNCKCLSLNYSICVTCLQLTSIIFRFCEPLEKGHLGK